jgi:hypothetical protein
MDDTPILTQWYFNIYQGEEEDEDWIEFGEHPSFVTFSDVTID